MMKSYFFRFVLNKKKTDYRWQTMKLYFCFLNWRVEKALIKKENQIIAWMLEINSLTLWPGLLTQLDPMIFFYQSF